MKYKDSYLIKTVINDLRHLQAEWNQDVDLNNVIRDSVILRRLLVDGSLQKAWQLCSYSFLIRIRTVTLSRVLSHYGKDRLLFAIAGGAYRKGVRFAELVGVYSREDENKLNSISESGPHFEELTLPEYINMSCMMIKGETISTVELIKYVANKLGGAHIDFNRDENKPLGKKFLLLDDLHNFQNVDQTFVPLELLSIGQAVIMSKHVQRLMKRQV